MLCLSRVSESVLKERVVILPKRRVSVQVCHMVSNVLVRVAESNLMKGSDQYDRDEGVQAMRKCGDKLLEKKVLVSGNSSHDKYQYDY